MIPGAKFVKDMFTEKDNQTWDLKRVTSGLVTVSGLGMQGYAIHQGQAFDFKAFCEGCAVLIAAIGAAVGMVALAKGETGQ